MKPQTKFIFALTIILGVFSTSAFGAEKLWRGSTMAADVAAKRWGSVEFDSSRFKTGETKVRSSMAASLQKHENLFKGKSALEIRELLGPFDGFYFTDAYLTYLIQIGKSHSEETWQIVFLLNDDQRVKKVIIHKNCCDR